MLRVRCYRVRSAIGWGSIGPWAVEAEAGTLAPMTEDPRQAVASAAQAFANAFNQKDAGAVGALFRADAEFVNIFGMRFRGRAGIQSAHAGLFARALSGNRLVVHEPDAQMLPGGVLLGHVPWTRDVLDGGGPALPPGSGILTMVLVREADGWCLAACTNVQDATPPEPPAKP